MTNTEVNKLGEFKLIKHLTEHFILHHQDTKTAVGDDAAVIEGGDQDVLISTDLMIEGIHFDLMYFPLKHLGYKAVISNISDICAMNAVAKQITVSIAMSNRFSVEALEELYKGIKTACDLYQVDLVGGDTSSSQKGLIISVTVIGKQKPEKISYRAGAKPGDFIVVTGDLGGAYLGLQLLEREKQIFLSDPNIKPELEEHKYPVERFLKPEARKDIISLLDRLGIRPNALIDLSDGMSSDLMHICESSKVGAIIEDSMLPIHEDSRKLAMEFKLDPTTCALHGGEDYELLMCIRPEDYPKIQYLPGFNYVGEILSVEEGIHLKTASGKKHPLQAQGWVHF
ncbi:MAG: thiamine-phosphate kinase [Saprospiraceae bacterium]|nr:thiamine-phosphate kinase [Saprospiraceae bacterium]